MEVRVIVFPGRIEPNLIIWQCIENVNYTSSNSNLDH